MFMEQEVNSFRLLLRRTRKERCW